MSNWRPRWLRKKGQSNAITASAQETLMPSRISIIKCEESGSESILYWSCFFNKDWYFFRREFAGFFSFWRTFLPRNMGLTQLPLTVVKVSHSFAEYKRYACAQERQIRPHVCENRPEKIYCFNCLLKDWHGLICLWLNTIIYDEQDDYLKHSAPITKPSLTPSHTLQILFYLILFITTGTFSIPWNIPLLEKKIIS